MRLVGISAIMLPVNLIVQIRAVEGMNSTSDECSIDVPEKNLAALLDDGVG